MIFLFISSFFLFNQFMDLINFFIPAFNIRFQFWPYIKLMIIFWLIIPDFGRASYVYNNLIRSFIYMKPQVVICKLKNWRKLFAKKENFLLHAERFIQENGTEALEKMIASEVNSYLAVWCMKGLK